MMFPDPKLEALIQAVQYHRNDDHLNEVSVVRTAKAFYEFLAGDK